MGYVNTVAHHTASAARHAGDPVWIRHANKSHRLTRSHPIYGLGVAEGGFDWGSLVKGVVDVGSSVATIALAREDSKDAQKAASKQAQASAAAAAAALAEQKRATDAQLALQQRAQDSKTALWKTVLPWAIGGPLVLGGAFLAYRMMSKRKRR